VKNSPAILAPAARRPYSSTLPLLAQLARRIEKQITSFKTGGKTFSNEAFNAAALGLAALQFELNPVFRQLCKQRETAPEQWSHWSEIPCVPAAAFKDFDVSCVPHADRCTAFHSSGTTRQRPGKHFHSAVSLKLYEASLLKWFRLNVADPASWPGRFLFLTPEGSDAPNSSLVHMFETIRRQHIGRDDVFLGALDSENAWIVNLTKAAIALEDAASGAAPVLIMGTAFLFVHLLDYLEFRRIRIALPAGSIAMETGGYKGRSRTMPKEQLHWLMSRSLGLGPDAIICEYGMSELSSQAYSNGRLGGITPQTMPKEGTEAFIFPPWARAAVVSAETGREVEIGETGLLRILDLANAFSAMGIQTEDMAVRRQSGFQLLGRAMASEPRGCSLMSRES
jgi:hypothetical protein